MTKSSPAGRAGRSLHAYITACKPRVFDRNGYFSDVMGISVEYGDIIDDILVISDILVKYVAFLKSGAIPSHHPYFILFLWDCP